MKATEINLKKDGFNFNCNTYPARSHYRFTMRLGCVFPTTRAQAKYFITEDIWLDVLNGDDVETVESMLVKHGFEGDYRFTKSKKWVRLQNQIDLHEALKKEYNL
jgi:hypothetical protein